MWVGNREFTTLLNNNPEPEIAQGFPRFWGGLDAITVQFYNTMIPVNIQIVIEPLHF